MLTLHEAVIIVLIKQPERTATYETIANEIQKRKLFPDRKENVSLSEQIRLRTSISSSKYKHMFEKVSKDKIKFI
jgi:hypothetical protein